MKYFIGDMQHGFCDDSMGFSLSDILPQITINTKQPLKNFEAPIKLTGEIVSTAIKLNPYNLSVNLIKEIPVLKDIYREVDVFTGGTFSTIQNVGLLPAKILDGKPISKAELIEAAIVAVKVAGVVATGGSAAALISVSAGQLRQGTLGKTSMGRSLLTIAEVAAGAYAIHQAATSQVASQATSNGTSMTAGEAVQEAVKGHIQKVAKTKAEEEFEKKTGIPVHIVTSVYDYATGKKELSVLPKDITKKIAETQLKAAGLGDSVTQAILSNNSFQLGVKISDYPDMALSAVERAYNAAKVQVQEELKFENIATRAKKALEDFKEKSLSAAALKEKLEKELDKITKEDIQKQLNKTLSQLEKAQKESLDLANQAVLQEARGGLLVAAAQEGRYPVNSNKALVAGAIGATIIGAYALS